MHTNLKPGAPLSRAYSDYLLAEAEAKAALTQTSVLNFEPPAPPPSDARLNKFNFHMLSNLAARQGRLEATLSTAMERIATVLDSVDLRLSRLEERANA
jgi:hypothetical protein